MAKNRMYEIIGGPLDGMKLKYRGIELYLADPKIKGAVHRNLHRHVLEGSKYVFTGTYTKGFVLDNLLNQGDTNGSD